MSKHADAVGYLRALETEINQVWFNFVCDQVIIEGKKELTKEDKDLIKAFFLGRASWLRPEIKSTGGQKINAGTAASFLEELTDFDNFKLLQPNFRILLKKNITLIFGNNGSGKSSVCDAFKILANHNAPIRPLPNLKTPKATKPTFSYKFKNNPSKEKWEDGLGFGVRHANIKYYDSTIAQMAIKETIEIGKIVEVAPFNLSVYERAKTLTSQMKDIFQLNQNERETQLLVNIASIKTKFVEHKTSFLSFLDESKVLEIETLLSNSKDWSKENELDAKSTQLQDLEKATSDEGLKNLIVEASGLKMLKEKVEELNNCINTLMEIDLEKKMELLELKKNQQVLMSEKLMPINGTIEELITVVKASEKLCDFSEGKDQQCPLCRRLNEQEQRDLFKEYANLINGQIEKDIQEINLIINNADDKKKAIKNIFEQDLGKTTHLSSDIISWYVSLISTIHNFYNKKEGSKGDILTLVDSLKVKPTELQELITSKEKAVHLAQTGRQELLKTKTTVSSEVIQLQVEKLANQEFELLSQAVLLKKTIDYWKFNIPKLTPILKKITDSEKDAYEDLVVSDFQTKFENEYKGLAEKNSSWFGISLSKKGTTSGVSVVAKIGGKDLGLVLSEGEQRLHSLALFFAELETCQQDVIVFDDPITSFDYNYITNFCIRLRNFIVSHPLKQIIVLTHNWEFFVNLQTVLNQHNLNNNLSVQIIENCSSVNVYQEKLEELKESISFVLSQANEPSKLEKETLAGNMRRLTENMINASVFNGQRHQYKQKSSAVSEFSRFTKLIPLTDQEATDLRDLYSKLSITEHDDPRNAYVNTDKSMFQTRYDQLIKIEQAILARRP